MILNGAIRNLVPVLFDEDASASRETERHPHPLQVGKKRL